MLRDCPVTPLRCRPMRRLRRVVVRQRPRARFRRAAIASAAVRPHGRGDPLRPRCNATRHGLAASCMPGVSPGRRSGPERSRAAAVSPFNLAEPPSGSVWPNVPTARRLPARHRDYRGAALDCALRRPRRLQPTTLPVAALWMAASVPRRHESLTRKVVSRSLAATGSETAFAACHTPFATSAPDRRRGSDRRHER